MNARLLVLAALAVLGVTLTPLAAAGPDAAKQRVAITVTILPSGKGVLTPLGKGALARDAGRFEGTNLQSARQSGRNVMRDGQQVDIYTGVVWTLTGKLGNLVLREERTEWTNLGQDLNRDGVGFRYGSGADGIATGTWKAVRGTGAYARISGGGRSSHLGQGRRWVARYEGFLVLPAG